MLQKELSRLEEAAQEKQKTGGRPLGISVSQNHVPRVTSWWCAQDVFEVSVLLWRADFQQLSVFQFPNSVLSWGSLIRLGRKPAI